MKKDKLLQLFHLIAGLIILSHGFELFEDADTSSTSIYLSLGASFLLIAGLHKWLNKSFQQADVAFFLIESVALAYSAWHYYEIENVILPYLLGFAALVYLIIALYVFIYHSDKVKRPSGRKRKRKKRPNPTSGETLSSNIVS